MLDTSYQAPASAPSGPTGRVCDFVSSIEFDDVPQEVRTNAKHLILDGIACALVGAQLPWSRTATNATLEMEGPGNCTVIGWNQRLNPMSAATLNSTFVQGFEFDDVHADAPWHANSVILPSLFAAAEHASRGMQGPKKFDGASFLLSTIVGFEIGSRVGLALYGSEMLVRGWHSGAVFGPPAAAAAVSKLLGLSPEEIEDAFGTARTQACGLTATRFESVAQRMQHGFAARNGLFAALMSREGFTGIDKTLKMPHGGFLSTFGNGSLHDEYYLPAKLTDGLGDDWEGMSGMRVKPYASQISTHAPINCIEVLQEEYPERFASLESIQKIKVTLAEAPFAHGGHQVKRPLNALGAQMSTRYTVAAQLLDKSVLMNQFSSAKLDRDDLWQLVEKIDCVWNREFDKLSAWHTRVTVDFGKGYTVFHEVSGPRTYDDALSNEGIRSKWSMLADSVLNAERKAQIEEIVLNMECLDDISQLIRLLGSEVKNSMD